MVDLDRTLLNNRIEAEQMLRGYDGKIIYFSDYVNEEDDDDDNLLEEYPEVLVERASDGINRMKVTSAALNKNSEIEFYVEELGKWVHHSFVLSASANSVYNAIRIVTNFS